jgi:hypothetical protein
MVCAVAGTGRDRNTEDSLRVHAAWRTCDCKSARLVDGGSRIMIEEYLLICDWV